MKKDDIMLLKITNKGAVIGIQMVSTALISLLNSKRFSNAKTIEDVRDDLLIQIEKMMGWLDREDDGTISKEENNKAKKEAREVKKMVEKQWNLPVM